MKSILILVSTLILAARSFASETNSLPSHPPVDTNIVSPNAQALSEMIESARTRDELEKQTPLDTNTISDKTKASLAMLKPGMTRAELVKHFEMDGGLNGPGTERYFIRDKKSDIKVIMVEVSFHPAGMDTATFADPAKKAAWFRNQQGLLFHPDDVVTAIGAPYFSFFHCD